MINAPAKATGEIRPERGRKTRSSTKLHVLWECCSFVPRQDGCPAHTAQSISDVLGWKCASYLADWPVRSRELSLISNLWGVTARRLCQRPIETNASLCNAVLDEWNSNSTHKICNLYEKRLTHMRELVAKGRRLIHYERTFLTVDLSSFIIHTAIPGSLTSSPLRSSLSLYRSFLA